MSGITHPFDLTDQVALVTGAGQGVGLRIAHMLAAAGARVAVNDVREDRARSAADAIRDAGSRAAAIEADVTDRASVERMFVHAVAEFGAVDILVNNAGNAGADQEAPRSPKPFWDTEPHEWEPYLSVNLMGVLHCSRFALPGMVRRNYGRIVTIISDAGRVGEANGLEVYSAAKAGAAGFTRGIARSVGRHGITANNVAISATNTPAIAAATADPELMKRVLSRYVIRRIGEPSDVAAMVLFLASPAAGWITGQTYPVNGGFSFAL